MLFNNGNNKSVYEPTIWLQGIQKDKILITYKRIRYGLQDDSICEEGYTYDLVFGNYIIQRSGINGLYELHEKLVHLIGELNHD